MGLFDGFEAGWNSFKNNELKTITKAAEDTGKVLISPSPIVKVITNPQKAWEDPTSVLPIEIGSNGPVVKDLDEQWNEVKEDYKKEVEQNINLLTSPNPLISAVTGNSDDILNFDKPATEKWENVTETVNETVVQPIVKETEKITETVKETVTNVTKGVTDALPIIAIGGAAVLVVSLLLGRR